MLILAFVPPVLQLYADPPEAVSRALSPLQRVESLAVTVGDGTGSTVTEVVAVLAQEALETVTVRIVVPNVGFVIISVAAAPPELQL